MGEVRYDFGGDVVLVTGAARGLGKDIALGFARAGAKVAVNDLEEPDAVPALAYDNSGRSELDATVAEIEANGADAIAVPADVRNESEVERMVAAERLHARVES